MNNTSSELLYQWLLCQEDSDNDDQRFYASYLIGHASLAMADSEDHQDFLARMQQNLDSALSVDKLSEGDCAGIVALWQAALAA